MVVERKVVITNSQGLHARAASHFVRVARRFSSEIEVERDGQQANGRSVIGILVLVAGKGDVVTIRGRGADADHALEALGALVDSGFGEADRSTTGGAEAAEAARPVECGPTFGE
jgi:phosphocarrier protein HPr